MTRAPYAVALLCCVCSATHRPHILDSEKRPKVHRLAEAQPGVSANKSARAYSGAGYPGLGQAHESSEHCQQSSVDWVIVNAVLLPRHRDLECGIANSFRGLSLETSDATCPYILLALRHRSLGFHDSRLGSKHCRRGRTIGVQMWFPVSAMTATWKNILRKSKMAIRRQRLG